jgi:N-methylhydantoinase B
VSPEAARRAYGVVLVARDGEVETEYAVDEAATAKLRGELRAARQGPLPLIDRGPGYERMLRGEEAPRL